MYSNFVLFLVHLPHAWSVVCHASLFPLSFCQQTKPLGSQVNSKFSQTLVLKNFINLAVDGLEALAFLICWCIWNKICVKYIWFDWGAFTCFPTSHWGFWIQAHIVLCVYMCESLCVCGTVWVCCQTMHDWPELLSSYFQWNVKPRDGEERKKGSEEDWKQRWKERGNNSSRQWSGLPAVLWGLSHIELLSSVHDKHQNNLLVTRPTLTRRRWKHLTTLAEVVPTE